MKSNPLVSVIVTTKNEEEYLRDCLESIREQKYPQKSIEIIIVDNNSRDKTKSIALEFTNRIFNKGPERSAQRNFGAKKASGKYYMYVDADMRLSKLVISEAVRKLEQYEKLVGLYIPEIIVGNNFWTMVRKFERSFYNATVIDCVRIVSTSAFNKTGGFDVSLTGPEDWDFDKKIRQIGKTTSIKACIYHDESSFNLVEYLSKKAYYSKSLNAYIDKWGRYDRDVQKQVGFYYRYIGVFIEKGKWKKLIIHPILSCKMFFLRFLVGIQYVFSKY